MNTTYDPFEFVNKIGLFTLAIIGSFITIKLLNAIYDNLYEPAIDIAIDSEKPDKYYIKIGKYYIHAGMIIKEFVKWFMLIIILMIIYNFVVNKFGRKKEIVDDFSILSNSR